MFTKRLSSTVAFLGLLGWGAAFAMPAHAAVDAKPVDGVTIKMTELQSSQPKTREKAAKWLGELRDPRAVQPLINVLEHDLDHDVREEAAKALSNIGGLEAQRALQRASRNDPKSGVRHAASKGLSHMAKENTKQVLR